MPDTPPDTQTAATPAPDPPSQTAATPFVVAIDGPSGAGKSTLGRRLAQKLGLLYLDTGAMYRAVALGILRAGLDPDDERAVADFARRARVNLAGAPDSLRVWLDGEEVSGHLRTAEIAHVASVISANPAVRRELVRRQREIAAGGGRGVVLDGRDIGTIVFPRAPVKFFLTATPEQRAARRFREGRDELDYEEVLRDVQERDRRDSTRADSPLAIADDAIVIDSTEEGIGEVLERMLRIVREKGESG